MNKIDILCVIDDDPIYIFGIKKIITLSNFSNSVMIFKNGQEAINNLKPIIASGENIPEVILLDINMPIMDGWQFLDEFIQIPCKQKVYIYIVSSSIDPADQEKIKEYGNISNFIVKPITIENLKEISLEVLKE